MNKSKYDDEIQRLEDRLEELQRKRADELCPFKIGDEVINKFGKRGRVVSILISYAGGLARIQLYKRNGELGNRITKGYEWDSWQLWGMEGKNAKHSNG